MGNKLEQMFGGRDKANIPYSTGFAYNTNCGWKFADAKKHMCRILNSLETDIDELDDALWKMDVQYDVVSKGVPFSKDIDQLRRLINWVHEVAKRYEAHLRTYWEYRERIGYSDLTPEEKKLMNDPKYKWDRRKEDKRCERN